MANEASELANAASIAAGVSLENATELLNNVSSAFENASSALQNVSSAIENASSVLSNVSSVLENASCVSFKLPGVPMPSSDVVWAAVLLALLLFVHHAIRIATRRKYTFHATLETSEPEREQ